MLEHAILIHWKTYLSLAWYIVTTLVYYLDLRTLYEVLVNDRVVDYDIFHVNGGEIYDCYNFDL